MTNRPAALCLAVSLLLASAAPPLSADACAPRTDWDTYTVAEGDVLFHIAARFNTTVDDLAAANCLATPNLIFAGQTLYVPPQTPAALAFAGVYSLSFASASGPVAVTMQLLYDGQARLTCNYENDGAVTSVGLWEADGDLARVILISQITADGQQGFFYRPETLVFAFQDGFLTAVEVDWTGLVFQDAYGEAGLVFTIGSSDINPSVVALQRLLAGIDFLDYTLPAQPGLYDKATRLAVVAFQESQGLTPTGVVDSATWAALRSPLPPTAPAPPDPPNRPPLIAAPGNPNYAPPAQSDNGPAIYLTFAGGPSSYTPQVLDLLAQYDAKATFFVVGSQAEANPQLIRRAASEGHYVGSHTQNYANLAGIGREGFINEVEATRQALLRLARDLFVLDGDVRFVQPPYGAADDYTRQHAAELGYTVVLWTVDPQDWRRPGAEQIAAHILAYAEPGAVILMHDGGGDRSQTVAALQIALPQLRAQGYVFRTVFDR
ncbi:MAG: polysaccharide deacetylase family protein [Aggregatilineales bacterium]